MTRFGHKASKFTEGQWRSSQLDRIEQGLREDAQVSYDTYLSACMLTDRLSESCCTSLLNGFLKSYHQHIALRSLALQRQYVRNPCSCLGRQTARHPKGHKCLSHGRRVARLPG